MSEVAIEPSDELRGLLLPLGNGNLLLPNAAVVEVLIYPPVKKPAANMPDWYLGRFRWRNLALPLVSWDSLMSLAVTTEEGLRKRVAVCHLFSAGDAGSFVGLETIGLPSLVSITEAELRAETDSADPESFILGELSLQGVVARIPDLGALAKMIASVE